jgi:hypothetical protein
MEIEHLNKAGAYLLMHESERGDVKAIGIFESHERAEEAVRRLSSQPGFKDWPTGFSIDFHPLNKINWMEGFGFEI